MLFDRLESKGIAHYSYIIGSGGTAAVIDPRRDCLIYVQKAAEAGMRIKYIFETHRNEDYVIGSVGLASLTGAEIWHADGQLSYHYGQAASDNQEWHLGQLKIRAIHSPGHTEGSMSYLLHDDGGVPWVLFSGDALFAGDVGRVDFLGTGRLREMAGHLYDTIFGKFLPLGDGTIVCPAHGAGSVCGSVIAGRPWTTIGIERLHNPMLQFRDRTSFIDAAAHELEKAPYFSMMERVNLQKPPALGGLPILYPLTAKEFREKMRECTIVDTRPPEAFAAGHIKGAISIWKDGLPGFAGWFLSYGKPLLFVTNEGDDEEIVRALVRIGYDSFAGRLSGGMVSWYKAGEKAVTNGSVTAPEVCTVLDSGSPVLFLDVRSKDELEKDGRFGNAYHIHITELPQRMGELPRAMPIYVFCASGLRSTIAASLLQREGFQDVSIVFGGFIGWSSVSCPLQVPSVTP
jgi:hydroxyacylglutathione hydrolase